MTRYAQGKKAIAECDICGFQVRLHTLRKLVVNLQTTNLMACKECFNPDHPQYQVGRYPVVEAEAVRDPRPDTTYLQSGLNSNDNPSEGSRVINWGWAPVGFNNPLGLSGLVDTLIGNGAVGTVSVTTE